jgi:hypothetical protein
MASMVTAKRSRVRGEVLFAKKDTSPPLSLLPGHAHTHAAARHPPRAGVRRAQGAWAPPCAGVPSPLKQLHNVWVHHSRCHTASWPATVTSLLTQPSGKTASGCPLRSFPLVLTPKQCTRRYHLPGPCTTSPPRLQPRSLWSPTASPAGPRHVVSRPAPLRVARTTGALGLQWVGGKAIALAHSPRARRPLPDVALCSPGTPQGGPVPFRRA